MLNILLTLVLIVLASVAAASPTPGILVPTQDWAYELPTPQYSNCYEHPQLVHDWTEGGSVMILEWKTSDGSGTVSQIWLNGKSKQLANLTLHINGISCVADGGNDYKLLGVDF